MYTVAEDNLNKYILNFIKLFKIKMPEMSLFLNILQYPVKFPDGYY